MISMSQSHRNLVGFGILVKIVQDCVEVRCGLFSGYQSVCLRLDTPGIFGLGLVKLGPMPRMETLFLGETVA